MSRRYPAYLETGRSRRRQRALDRQIGRMVQGSGRRGMLFASFPGGAQTGWFRLPGDARPWRRWLAGGRRGSGKLFDYIAAGGARWIGARPADVPFERARKTVYGLALGLLAAWWVLRRIPPP